MMDRREYWREYYHRNKARRREQYEASREHVREYMQEYRKRPTYNEMRKAWDARYNAKRQIRRVLEKLEREEGGA